jgi:hypothetical protein
MGSATVMNRMKYIISQKQTGDFGLSKITRFSIQKTAQKRSSNPLILKIKVTDGCPAISAGTGTG